MKPLRSVLSAGSALIFVASTASAAPIPNGLTWLPSDPLDITLGGTQQYDLWLNMASGANMNRTTPFVFGGNTFQTPYNIPGVSGTGMFPGMAVWNPVAVKSQFWSTATQGELYKLANGTGGGPYSAGQSMYFGGTSGDFNVDGGSLGAKGYAIPNVKTVAFQMSLGEAYGYGFHDKTGNGIGPEDMPKLNVYDTSGALITTLDATHQQVIKKAYNGSLEMPPGSGLVEDIYISTYGLQWDLSQVEGEIGSFRVDFTAVQHAQLWSFRLDQSTQTYAGFVFNFTSEWTGTESALWSNTANWQAGSVPTSVSKAIFGTGNYVELTENTTIGQILIRSGQDLSIGTSNGSTLSTSLNITTEASGGPRAHQIPANLNLPAVATVDVGPETSLTIPGNITGLGFFKRNSGPLVLSGTNVFGSSTAAATLVFGGGVNTITGQNTAGTYAGSLLDLKNTRVILQGNDRFSSAYSAQLAGTSTVGQTAVLQLGDETTGGVTQTLAALTAGKPQYVKDLNPNPQFEPPVYVVGGNVALSTLTLNGGTYSGTLGGSGTHENNLAVVVNGPVNLQGLASYVGDTTVTGTGVLQLNRASALSSQSNLFLNGGTLALGSFGYMTAGGTNNNGVYVTEALDTFTRPLGTGPGEVRLSGNAGFKAVGGNRTVNLGGSGGQLAWGQENFVSSGGSLNLSADGSWRIAFANALDLGNESRTVQVTVGNAELSGNLSGSGGLTKSGNGFLYLSGTNSHTGPTRVNQGQLAFATLDNAGGNSILGNTSAAAANLILAGGTINYTGSADSATNRLFTIAGANGTIANDGTGTLHFTSTSAIAYDYAGAVTFTLRGTNNARSRFDPQITNNGSYATSVTKAGDGMGGGNGGLWFIGNEGNNYTGRTLIQGGILEVTKLADGGLPSSIGASSSSAANLPMFRAGLRYTGAGDETDRLFAFNVYSVNYAPSRIDSSGAGPLKFTNTGNILTTDVNGTTGVNGNGGWLVLGGTNTGDNRLAPRIGGYSVTNSRLTKDGVGTWTVSHTANSFTGITEILGGTLAVTRLTNGGRSITMNTTNGSTAATVTDATGLVVGQTVEGIGITPGTTISALNGLNVTLSVAATATYTSGTNRTKYAGFASSLGVSPDAAANLVVNGGTLRYVGTGDSSSRQMTVGANGATLDASGTGVLQLTAATMTFSGTAARTLRLSGTNTGTNTLSAVVPNAGAGVTSLVKSGGGTWRLSAAGTYTGGTTIQEGTLSLAQASLSDSSDVSISTGATLNLEHSGAADTVKTLTLGGVLVRAGTWGAVGSDATFTSPYITGTGKLNVTTGPYEMWSAGISDPAKRARTGDADGDGLTNVQEFLFGASSSAATQSLTQSLRSGNGIILRWIERNAGGAYQLQESTTLGGWQPSTVVPTVSPDQSAVPESHTRKQAELPFTPGKKFLRVQGAEN